AEAFADRAYQPDGQLVSRREAGAVLHDPDMVAARMLRLAIEGVIEAVDGSFLRLEAGSICVHGDSPGAVAMARHIRETLVQAGVTIASFTGGGA
ncbi:MAG: LamB/YcsF family protein, partial [Gemmobacter sp.]